MSKMAWFVHYWDEINNRNICSSEISAREDAMRKACSLMREGHVVSHVAGPNGERIDIVDYPHVALRACKPLVWLHVIRLPPPWTVEDLPRHSVGWLEQPRDLGRLAVTPEGKRRHDRGISSHSDLP